VRLSPGTDLSHAACAEPFAVCLHAVLQGGPLLGRRVLVTGCGPIGCLTVLAAARAGAAQIIATDLTAAPLAIARRMGATRVIDLSADPDALDALARDKGTVDATFECSGSPKAMQSACAVTRPRGTIVAVGLGGETPMPLGLIVTKELSIRGSFASTTNLPWPSS
jgi:L-idonate 5-dehydrogenase